MSSLTKTTGRVLAIFALILAATVFFIDGARAAERPASAAKDLPFEVVDGAHRELDGSPALGLSFSLPLDAKMDHGKYLQVLEMPPGDDKKKTAKEGGEASESSAAKPAVADSVSRAPEDTVLDGGQPVSGAWVVGENPRLLFFPHIKPQTRYVVRVHAGLPARGGARLAREERFSIRTAAVAPAYYFASRGMVLPAAQNGGLPVITVNTPEVDIQFLKVKPEQVEKFLERVIAGKAKPAPRRVVNEEDENGECDECAEEDGEEVYYGYGSHTKLQGLVRGWTIDQFNKMTESVFVGRFLTEAKANRRGVTFIPVETIPALREPGIYIAVMSQPNRFRGEYQTTYFYVSDLGLHLRQYLGQGADAFVSSLTTGKGVSGVEVSWIGADDRTLAFAETDAGGRAAFAERPRDAKVVIARKGRQISLIALKEPALDLAEFDVGGLASSPLRLFAYSGRNLYRPGERFEVSVLARDADGMPVPAQPIQAILRRPDGKAQWTATWSPHETFAGYYQRQIELPTDAATGFWNLELRADPADKRAGAVMRIGVEEFLPERMKLDLSSEADWLDAGSEVQTWEIGVAGSYLYGSPAADNQLLGVVNTERNRNPLARELPGFVFGDANEDELRSRHELGERALDAEGEASVDVDLAALQKRRSPFTVRATLSLLESGGRPVVRSIERTWWPAPVLVGLRPLFGGSYAREGALVEFDVVRADAAGNLQAGASLPVRLFRENRHYYWRFDDERGWHSGFTETDELVLTTQVSVPAGDRGKLAVPVKYGRYRVEVLDPETGSMARFRFYAGWFAKDDETQGVRPDRVALRFDKPGYAEGETAKLTITPPHAGEALITVEGDKLLWMKRLPVGVEGTTVDIPVDKAWSRHDLYVTAMVLRPGVTDKKDLGVTPARALGIAYLPLERGGRKLGVTLEAPKRMEPNQALKVKIKVAGLAGIAGAGRTAMVTLSAVDVGILNITRFASPDPFGFFFGKLRYGHDLYDIYGRLIEKMAGQKGKLKWGGDGTPEATKSMPEKVLLVDLFSGPVALDAQGEAEISLPVPDFNGSLRLMAVAAEDGRFGMQEAEVVLAAPLIVELATPRFLSVGDSALLALDVQNLAGEEQEVAVKVSNDDGLVIRDGEQKIKLGDQQKKVLRIPIEAGTADGLTEVRIDIDSPSMKHQRRFALQVQAPTPRQTILRRYAVAPGETLEIRDAGLSGLLRQTATAALAVSDRAPIDVKNAVRGLLTYPYGCAEQTTSTAYPHVFIDEAEARRYGLQPYTLARRAEMLDQAIGRLAGMQAANGGFSLWGGGASEYQYWLSAYIAHFLLDTREQGFNAPPEMENKAVDFLLRGLQEGVAGLPRGPLAYNENAVWRDYRYAGSGRFGVLAYGAYVLARHGKAPLSTLRQMHEARQQAYSGLNLAYLGLALKLMGDEARAAENIDAAIARPRLHDGRWWGDYGSQLRDAALVYVLLQKHGLAAQGRENLVAQVAGEIERKNYLSTQEKLAVFLLGRSFAGQQSGAWSAELSAPSASSTHSGREKALDGRGTQFAELSPEELATGVWLRNTHTQRLFVELNLSGSPASMPAARRDFFDLKREWYTADGQPLGRRTLVVGESLIARVNVKTHGRYANALIVDYVPAGVEIENANLAQGEQNALRIGGIDIRQAMLDTRIKHQEFRDDRFVAAVRAEGEMNLFYRVRVVTPGRFVAPPTYAEDMYQPMVYGLAGGGEIIEVEEAR
ncbi:MAG: alpha-2-macroglobulin family protein [Candidatus Accumulibacter sp.]|jgi:uncharacterized protein YfaS (alpha-2-macroglobulin family)|nr:alpha-2-macroglobulin family protein [Accumulibacter sp.]